MFVNSRDFLIEARRGGWAVGGFNAYNLESARAILGAADELRSPVILQTSAGAVAHAGLATMVALANRLAADVRVPVALHLDHGKDPELVRAAVAAGYSSVMIDGSSHPLDDNIALTRGIVELAHGRGVQVEAELGSISGIEDLGDEDIAETLTAASEAARFVAETGVDSLAIAIGTAHGATKFASEPRLDFDRLEAIAGLVEVPLVLHGASAVDEDEVARAEAHGAALPAARGIPEPFVRRAIGLGIAKVNTDSDLRLAALARIRELLDARPELFNMYELMGEVEAAICQATRTRIELLGSAGRAAP